MGCVEFHAIRPSVGDYFYAFIEYQVLRRANAVPFHLILLGRKRVDVETSGRSLTVLGAKARGILELLGVITDEELVFCEGVFWKTVAIVGKNHGRRQNGGDIPYPWKHRHVNRGKG